MLLHFKQENSCFRLDNVRAAQRDAVVRGVVFTTTMIARLMFNSHASLVVASLDKMLHDNYLCVMESNEQ